MVNSCSRDVPAWAVCALLMWLRHNSCGVLLDGASPQWGWLLSWAQMLWACWYGGLAPPPQGRSYFGGVCLPAKTAPRCGGSVVTLFGENVVLVQLRLPASCGRAWAASEGAGSHWGCLLGVAGWKLLWKCTCRWIGQGKSTGECPAWVSRASK